MVTPGAVFSDALLDARRNNFLVALACDPAGGPVGAAWADELAKWRYPEDTWDMLQFGLHLGLNPRELVTTILARSIQTSHAALAPNISAQSLGGLDPGFLQAVGGVGETAYAMANAEINRQAMMIGYLNDFWGMAIVTALSVPLVFFLRRPRGPIEKPDPAAAGH